MIKLDIKKKIKKTPNFLEDAHIFLNNTYIKEEFKIKK